MKSNITLIGMPGAGKSTVGVILAKYLSFGFMDTDILIQIEHQRTLQAIIDESGYLELRKIEAEVIQKIDVVKHVIATGGSAVYSEKAMQHLKKSSTVVFLKVDYDEIKKRIHNFNTRGIAKAEGQTFKDLFNERQILYNRYAEFSIDSNDLCQEEIAKTIASTYKAQRDVGVEDAKLLMDG